MEQLICRGHEAVLSKRITRPREEDLMSDKLSWNWPPCCQCKQEYYYGYRILPLSRGDAHRLAEEEMIRERG